LTRVKIVALVTGVPPVLKDSKAKKYMVLEESLHELISRYVYYTMGRYWDTGLVTGLPVVK
jgi:hypothetical protein